MKQSFEKLATQYEAIPAEVQDAISSVAVAEQLQKIGESSRLHLDQIEILFDEVGSVMLGITKPSEFGNNLKKQLPLSEQEVETLVQEINDNIFKPIKASLMKMYPSGPSQEQIDHGNVSAHEILDGIENPWRMSFKVEPIQPILPKEEMAAEKKMAEPEKIAPETLAELPPSLRPSLTQIDSIPTTPVTATPTPDVAAPPLRVMPKGPSIAPPPVASYEIPIAPQQKSVPPPPNLPTKEGLQPVEGKTPELTRTSQQVVEVGENAETARKPRIDPYREAIK